VTLTNGTYTFLCDPHPSTMTRTFTVGSTTTTTTATRLAASVSPSATIALMKSGKKVKTLTAGTYRLTVSDRSATGNFHLTGPGVNRKTAIAQKTTATWQLTLKAGTYTYRSDANPRVKGTFTVAAA